MLAHSGMLFFHLEGHFSDLQTKRLIIGIFCDLFSIRVENPKLLVLCLQVNCKIDETVHSNIWSGQTIKRGLSSVVASTCGPLLRSFPLLDGRKTLRRGAWLCDAPARWIGELRDTSLLAQALIDFIVSGTWPRIVTWYIVALLRVEAELGCRGAPFAKPRRRRSVFLMKRCGRFRSMNSKAVTFRGIHFSDSIGCLVLRNLSLKQRFYLRVLLIRLFHALLRLTHHLLVGRTPSIEIRLRFHLSYFEFPRGRAATNSCDLWLSYSLLWCHEFSWGWM